MSVNAFCTTPANIPIGLACDIYWYAYPWLTHIYIHNSCHNRLIYYVDPLTPRAHGYHSFGIAVMTAIALFVCVGFASVFVIKGKSENFFVAGRSLPLWVSRLCINKYTTQKGMHILLCSTTSISMPETNILLQYLLHTFRLLSPPWPLNPSIPMLSSDVLPFPTSITFGTVLSFQSVLVYHSFSMLSSSLAKSM